MKPGLRIVAAVSDMMRLFSLLLLVPIPVAFVYDRGDLLVQGVLLPTAAVAFAASAVLVAAVAQILRMVTKRARDQELVEREAYLAVAGSWLVLGTAGALPLLVHLGPVDAWFEAMSGITATGATVLADIEATAPSLLFWRSLLQFVGGFAVVVVVVALLARLTHGGAQLLPSDFGASGSRVRPKIREAAGVAWGIYAVLGALVALGYLGAMRYHVGLPWKQAVFDALVHAGSTVSAGGFSSHTGSIGFFDSWAVEAVAVAGMLLAGTSFALIPRARQDFKRLLKDREWRFYILVVLLGGLGTTGLLSLAGYALGEAVGASFFTLVSIGTTTGYATVDHDGWPILARTGLLVAMFTGAMAGSAAGGIKLLRIMLLLKVARREIRKLLHPRAVLPVRHGKHTVQEQTLLTIIAFFFVYVTIWMVGAGFLIAMEPRLDLFDGSAAAAAAIGNVGPATGPVGPFDHYGFLGTPSKLMLGTLMWIGRVEVFSVLLLLSPSSWRQ